METDESKRGIRKFLLKRMLFVPLGIVALAATSYARQHPDWAEHVYAQGVYPALSSVVGFLPSLVSFSVAEWVAALFLLFCVGYVVYCVRKLVVSKGERGTVAYRAVMGAVSICCVVYFLFTALCGLNYYRYTFTQHTGYDVEEADADAAQRQEELVRLASSLADDLGQTRAQLGDDADLFDAEPGQFEQYAQESVEAMRKLAEQEMNRKLEEAARAEAAGDTAGAEFAMVEAEVMEGVSISGSIQAQTPKAAGVSQSKTWEIVSIDSSKVPVSFEGVEIRPVDVKAVMRLIKESKGTIQIPGVQYRDSVSISVRA